MNEAAGGKTGFLLWFSSESRRLNKLRLKIHTWIGHKYGRFSLMAKEKSFVLICGMNDQPVMIHAACKMMHNSQHVFIDLKCHTHTAIILLPVL